jgi:hypothetical protein
MNRRAVLTSGGATVAGALAGSLDLSSSPDSVSASGATVEQGETADITIAGQNLSGVQISDFPEEFRLDGPLDLGEGSFDPSPDAVWQAYPPYWEFSGRDVEGTVPIRTAPDAPLDTYRFGFDFDIDGEEEPRYEETTVTVEGES